MRVRILAFAGLMLFALVAAHVHSEDAKKVTPENFIRAETDNMYAAMIENAGGTNKFFHFRKPTPLDGQTVIRMNRDVLYSGGVFDAEDGISINFPELPDDRYASVYIIDNDHYVVDIIHEPGTHTVKGDTRFLYVIIRIQLKDASSQQDVALVNSLQDQFKVTSKTGGEFPGFQWDRKSLDALRSEYEEGSKKFDSWAGMMGKRGEVNEDTRHFAAAAAWGLLPEQEATYLNYQPASASADKCYTANYQVPDNEGFWSITVYGKDGFMKSDNNVLNEANTKLDDDGTFTAYFGPEKVCGKVSNRVDTSDGWNFLFRIYRPGKSVLDGEYSLPEVQHYESGRSM